MNKKNLIAIFLSLLIVLGTFLYYQDQILAIFKQTAWSMIGILVGLHIAVIAGGGLIFEIICRYFNIQLRYRDWIGLSFVANFINQLLPYRPGIGIRYLYLQQHYHMQATEFFKVMVIYFLISLSSGLLCVLLGLQRPEHFSFFYILTWIIGAIGLGCLLRYHLPIKRQFLSLFSAGFRRKFFLKNGFKSSEVTSKKIKITLQAVFISLLINMLSAAIFFCTFTAINYSIPFSTCVLLVGIATLAMLFPLTPGNIGILESLGGGLTQLLYQDFSIGFSAIALYRTSMWIPSLVLGVFFSFWLLGEIIPSVRRTKFGNGEGVD